MAPCPGPACGGCRRIWPGDLSHVFKRRHEPILVDSASRIVGKEPSWRTDKSCCKRLRKGYVALMAMHATVALCALLLKPGVQVL